MYLLIIFNDFKGNKHFTNIVTFLDTNPCFFLKSVFKSSKNGNLKFSLTSWEI